MVKRRTSWNHQILESMLILADVLSRDEKILTVAMKVDDITIKTDTALLDLGTHFVLEENDISQ